MWPDGKKAGKNLLMICHSYNDFQKDPTEINAPHFSSVTVLVRANFFAELGYYLHLPIPQLRLYSSHYKIDRTGTPANVHLHLTPVLYFPTDPGYKKLGDRHLSCVEAVIQKHGIAFDLVHAHFIWSSGYVGARLKEKYGIPFVVTAHGEDIYSLPFKDTVWRKNIEYVLNTADAIITVSRRNLECIRKLDVTTPVHLIPNGFRSDLFCPKDQSECKREVGLPLDRKIILAVGILEEVKGHRYLLEAISAVIRKKNDILCVIVGEGSERSALENQIRSLGLEDHVILAGMKPHNEIPVWINACDIFVLPSLNEGNPTVLFEALGCGKPFIGSNVGGVPDIITSDIFGLIVNPADQEDMTEKILMALDRTWDRNAILMHAKQYTWENIAQDVLRVLSSVTQKQSRCNSADERK
jgi:glycosyltransferase involved in cell wall biosynthesis